jgi:uncharacterized protein (DUF58 family)
VGVSGRTRAGILDRWRRPTTEGPLPQPSGVVSPSQARVSGLQLTVLRRLDGLLSGDHAGLLPGNGSERGEARPYVAGDDPRHIDWAVTARTNEPHVRDTIADHELELWLVVDASSSLAFGTGLAAKYEMAWAAAGAFALLASKGGNRVGAITSGSPRRVVPARSGSSHIGALLTAIHTPPQEDDPGDLPGAIDLLCRVTNRRGMAVVVSDFLGQPTWERPLRALAHSHEVIAVEVIDRREVELPDVGLIAVVDPETGRRRLVDTADAQVRARYAEVAAARRADVASRLAALGADQLTLSTDRDWVLDLVRFVASRRARLASSARTHR